MNMERLGIAIAALKQWEQNLAAALANTPPHHQAAWVGKLQKDAEAPACGTSHCVGGYLAYHVPEFQALGLKSGLPYAEIEFEGHHNAAALNRFFDADLSCIWFRYVFSLPTIIKQLELLYRFFEDNPELQYIPLKSSSSKEDE